MTDPNNTHEHDTPHEGPIKTPKQLIVAVFFAFVIPVIGIILLANFVTAGTKPGAGSEGLDTAAVTQRIAPIGRIEVKDPTDVAAMKPGNVVFESQCIACHGTGAAGAPKFGDAAAWAPRLPSGFQALWNSALHGKGAMPPQSGGDFSDLEIGRAVVYMTSKVGGTFTEPTLDEAYRAFGLASESHGLDDELLLAMYQPALDEAGSSGDKVKKAMAVIARERNSAVLKRFIASGAKRASAYTRAF